MQAHKQLPTTTDLIPLDLHIEVLAACIALADIQQPVDNNGYVQRRSFVPLECETRAGTGLQEIEVQEQGGRGQGTKGCRKRRLGKTDLVTFLGSFVKSGLS